MKWCYSIWLLLSASLASGCAGGGKAAPDSAPAAANKNSAPTTQKVFSYTSTRSADDREAVLADIKAKHDESESEFHRMVELMATMEAFRGLQSPQERLGTLQDFRQKQEKYDKAKAIFVQELAEFKQLIQLLRTDEERVDQLAECIRDEYREKYAAKFEIAYVNELLAGRVHGRAAMLANRLSDHAVNGIHSRYSHEHIIKTSHDIQNDAVLLIIDELEAQRPAEKGK